MAQVGAQPRRASSWVKPESAMAQSSAFVSPEDGAGVADAGRPAPDSSGQPGQTPGRPLTAPPSVDHSLRV